MTKDSTQWTHKRVIIDYTKRDRLPRIVYCLVAGHEQFDAMKAVSPAQWAKSDCPDITSESARSNIARVAFDSVRKTTPFGRLVEATKGADRGDALAMLTALGLAYHGR